VIVAKQTGWGLSDLLNMTMEELLAWHKAAEGVDKEIEAKTKRR
jgi:hypothetical protein